MNRLGEEIRFVQGMPPVADFGNGTVYSDVINCKGAAQISFIVIRGVAAGAETQTITVQACDDTTPNNTSAIPFVHRQINGSDVEAAQAAATTAGYLSTAATNAIDIIDVDVNALGKSGYGYCRLKLAEVADYAVLGGILVALSILKDAGDQKASFIV
jgi:hypothetical protein